MTLKKIDTGIFTEYHITEHTTNRDIARRLKNAPKLRTLEDRLKNLETKAERICRGITKLSDFDL